MPTNIPPMADLPPLVAPQEATQEDEDTLAAGLDAPDADPPEDDIVMLDDGSAIVKDKDDDKKPKGSSDFDVNLAELFDQATLTALGRDMCEYVEQDKEDRADRDKQYAKGIKRTGMSDNQDVGADFDGASSVVHPMLAKGCVDFASKAMKELFPSSGPVKTQIIGDQTEVKLERAERKKTYMNWQLTDQIPEHRPEFEKMLSQLPLGGSQYKRWWYDSKMQRARTQAVYIDDIFLPFDQNDFYTTPRLTHREFIGQAEFESRVDSGLYIELDVLKSGEQPERSSASEAARKVEGVTDESASTGKLGGQHEMYTIYADLDLEEDDKANGLAPYIIHVEKEGERVVGLYRNWAEDDDKQLKLHWIVEYNFIPWRGAYAVGLAHLIGSMSTSATGALNALLDAAHINNFPGGLKLKGGRNSGQSVTVNATELKEIDAPPGVDDIRKLVMPFPFNGPSTVLYQLLEWLTQQAEMVVSTASEKIADAGANMPMGTALALIEGGSTNFSAIHARMHHSARKELEILHRLNATYMEDEETIEELGELVVYRSDFAGPMDIIPVSDPNIFSEAQRYAQLQAVMQLEAMPEFKPFFKPGKLLVKALRLLQVPYAEDIANLPRDPKRMPPVDENSAACDEDDIPLKVYSDQDDLGHLESHVLFMTSPLLGGGPLVGTVALPKLLKHCREHLVAYYKKHHKAAADALKMIAKMQGHEIDDAQAEAKGHAFADKAMAQQLSTIVAPGLEQAQKLLMQFAPKPPADGNTLATIDAEGKQFQMKLETEVKDAEARRKHEASEAALDRQAKQQLAAAETASEEKIAAVTTMLEKQGQALEMQIAQMTLAAQEQRDQSAAFAARLMAEFKAQSDQQLVLLKEFAKTMAAPPPPDMMAVIQPLLEAMQENSQSLAEKFVDHGTKTNDVLGQVAQALGALAPPVR